jgi:hypothetical protein
MRADINAHGAPLRDSLTAFGQKLDAGGLAAFARMVRQEAHQAGFLNDSWLIAMSLVGMLPLLLLIRAFEPVKAGPARAAMQ